MEKLAKYNINFIVAAISSLIIIGMVAYMIMDLETIIMRVLIVLEFVCSFYFVCVFFYRISRYSRFELFFYLVVYLMPFILSIFGLFYALDFFSINRIFLRDNIIASFLTRVYHILFIFYITHIIYFFYLFVLGNKKTFFSIISTHYIIMLSTVLGVMFVILYAVLNWLFDDRIIASYKNTKNDILYEAQTTFYGNNRNDEIEYEGFAKTYNVAILYYENELKYRVNNWEEFENKHLLFETSIIQGNGFFIIISGKEFTYPYYIFIVIYVIILSVILTLSIMLSKIFFKNKFESYMNIMIKGFRDDNYICTINTDDMEESELRTLAELYNSKLLSYKYRERYLKLFNK